MKPQPRIMYIEFKGEGLAGPARIGRVTYSDSGKTIYYGGKSFRSLKGGYKANYIDAETGEKYWISGCKKSGEDTLYPGTVDIDADVREEYWRVIRNKPDRMKETSFRTLGKYSKRKPK